MMRFLSDTKMKMYLLYCDETNLERKPDDFFVYGGVAIDGEKAVSLSQKIDKIRACKHVPRNFRLKFNPAPDKIDHTDFNELKQQIIEAAADHCTVLLVSIILHNIANSPAEARIKEINRICAHFDWLLNRLKQPGLVLIDRFQDKNIDSHLAEKFSIGLKGLRYSREMRLKNVVGFHYSAIGQAHFCSIVDIVLGSLRFAINAFTRKDEKNMNTARVLLNIIAPLFWRENGDRVAEISFFFSPKKIKVEHYRQHYIDLKNFLAEEGIETAQPITEHRLY